MVQHNAKKESRLTPLGHFMISILFIAVTAVIGMIVGYSVIGEGNPIDVFKLDTWVQLYEVVINSLF